MTTPSLHKQTGISLSVFKPSIDTSASPVAYVPDAALLKTLTEEIDSWKQTISAFGGYDKAHCTLKGSREEIEDWFDGGLGRHVVAYGTANDVIWEGIVNKLSINLGYLAATRGPLLDIVNCNAVVYSTIDTSTNPPTMGQRERTAVATDSDSQERYGVVEKVLSVGGATQTMAEQVRDTYLQENKLPVTSQRLTERASAEPSVTLECLGYVHWLKSYVYNQTANSGTQDLSAKLQAVLDAELNTIVNGNYDLTTNTLAVDRYENDDKTAWALAKALVAVGDANDNRYLFGVYAGRKAVYAQAPTTDVAYQQRPSAQSGRVELVVGGEVPPWNVLPGKWLFLSDFLAGRTQPTERRFDPRYIFIESVTYTAPWKLNIVGGKVDELPQVLARAGLAGVGA